MSSRSTVVRLLGAGLLTLLGPGALTAQDTRDPVAGTPSPGDTVLLTLTDARRLALTRNPELQATRRLRDMARGRLRQARVFRFNPEFSIESEQVGEGRTLVAYEGELSQQVEWAGQRGLRIQSAELAVTRTDERIRNAARTTVARAAGAFYESLAAHRRLEVAEELLAANERLLAAVSDMLDAGSISRLDANLAQIESGRARARVLTERRNARSALLSLKRVLGLPSSRPIRLSHEVPEAPDPGALDPDSLVASALARRPDLSAAGYDVEVSRTMERLARREAIPNLRLAVPFDRLEGPGSRQIGIGIGLSIPLWDRNQGTVAELRADIERARIQRDAVELAVRTEVLDALQRYASATDEAEYSEAAILQPARTNQALLDEAFRAGKIDLPTLLLLRNELLDAELDYWESWLERRAELVRLEAVTAQPLPKP